MPIHARKATSFYYLFLCIYGLYIRKQLKIIKSAYIIICQMSIGITNNAHFYSGRSFAFLQLICMGYSEEQIHVAFAKVSETSRNKESSSLWFAILFHLRLDRVESMHPDSDQIPAKGCPATSSTYSSRDIGMLFFLVSVQVAKDMHCPCYLQ